MGRALPHPVGTARQESGILQRARNCLCWGAILALSRPLLLAPMEQGLPPPARTALLNYGAHPREKNCSLFLGMAQPSTIFCSVRMEKCLPLEARAEYISMFSRSMS